MAIKTRIVANLLNDVMEFAGLKSESEIRRRGVQAYSVLKDDWDDVVDKNAAANLDKYYSKADAYLYDLMNWHLNEPGRPVWTMRLGEIAVRHNLQTALDVGCGIAQEGLLLADNGLDVTLCDYPNASYQFAQWRAKKYGLSERIRFLSAPMNWGVVGDFDMIVAIDVLEHVQPQQVPEWISEIAYKAQGWIALSAPFADGTDSAHPQHYALTEEIDPHLFLVELGWKALDGLIWAWCGLS